MKHKLILGFITVILVIVVMNAIGTKFISVEWQRQLFSIASVLITGLILGSIFTNSVVRNVKKLVKASEEVSRGDLTINLDFTSEDEIGALAESFTRMVDDLQGLISHIKNNSQEISSSSISFESFAKD